MTASPTIASTMIILHHTLTILTGFTSITIIFTPSIDHTISPIDHSGLVGKSATRNLSHFEACRKKIWPNEWISFWNKENIFWKCIVAWSLTASFYQADFIYCSRRAFDRLSSLQRFPLVHAPRGCIEDGDKPLNYRPKPSVSSIAAVSGVHVVHLTFGKKRSAAITRTDVSFLRLPLWSADNWRWSRVRVEQHAIPSYRRRLQQK